MTATASTPPHIRRRGLLAPDVLAVVEAAEAAGAPPESSVAELRAAHDREAPLLSGRGPRLASVGDLVIPGPHGWLPMRAYAPRTDRALPVVAYLHGGGWTVGSIASFDGVARELAVACGALVVSIGYRLAPEHPFPAPVDEAVAALRWLADHAGSLGGDGSRLAVAGDSAGANLAAVAARRLRDEEDRRCVCRRSSTRRATRRSTRRRPSGSPRASASPPPPCSASGTCTSTAPTAITRTPRRCAPRSGRPAAGVRRHRGGRRAARRRRGLRRRVARAQEYAPRSAGIPAPCTDSGAGPPAPTHRAARSARSGRPCAHHFVDKFDRVG